MLRIARRAPTSPARTRERCTVAAATVRPNSLPPR